MKASIRLRHPARNATRCERLSSMRNEDPIKATRCPHCTSELREHRRRINPLVVRTQSLMRVELLAVSFSFLIAILRPKEFL